MTTIIWKQNSLKLLNDKFYYTYLSIIIWRFENVYIYNRQFTSNQRIYVIL